MKKFELTAEYKTLFGKKIFRIKALVSFGDVEAGEMGGYVEKEENLSHDGNAWVYGNARVSGDAWVSGDAQVYGDAWVYGNARVSGDAWVSGDAQVYGDAWVYGDARVYGYAQVYGDARVYGYAQVYGDARVYGNADYACVKGFGRECRNTTFFRCEDKKVRVVCGCFYGDIEEFRAIVKKTHGETKMAKEYLLIADLMEMHFSE